MVQIIKCKCGAVFAGCLEPECYIDKDWLDSLRDYVEYRKCTVHMVESKNIQFTSCTCKKNKREQIKTTQLKLY